MYMIFEAIYIMLPLIVSTIIFNKETLAFEQTEITLYDNEDSVSFSKKDDELCRHPSAAELQDPTFHVPDEAKLTIALRDIAYYLRNYKFNGWDRRHYKENPGKEYIGFYRLFPTPPLRSLHWKVTENCESNFYKCVTYLYEIVNSLPMTRNDDVVTIFNERQAHINEKVLKKLDMECKQALYNAEKSALPFDSMAEKFQWSITAAYYMCWYTMLETPALSMLGETCDNFANCLDKDMGAQNNDPRSDDTKPFACATYSFCPDSCCPTKHVESKKECYDNTGNPCFSLNSQTSLSHRRCYSSRKNNQNFKDITKNKWNVSCYCKDKGFVWESEFGICVDVNECVTSAHKCNKATEDCLNLPGTYECICKWGFRYNKKHKKCVKTNKPFVDSQMKIHSIGIKSIFLSISKFFGF